MRRFGIERQAQLLAIIPIIVIAALLESYFIYARFDDLDHALLERSKLLARQLASSSEYAVFSGDPVLLKQYVDSAMIFQDVKAIQILDASFSPLFKAGQLNEVISFPQGSQETHLDQNRNLLRLYEPILATQIKLDNVEDISADTHQSLTKNLGMVVIEFSKERLNRQKTEIITINILITLVILSITLMMALRVARKITRPILGMRKAIIEIGEGALDTRISPKPKILELHDLAEGINKMAQQLQVDRSTLQDMIYQATIELRAKKEEAEKSSFSKTRFLAAASHDLRQPMHALGLFIAELQSLVDTLAQRKIVLKIEESVEAMSGLLNSLLDISKLDAGVIVPQWQDFNIEHLLQRCAQNYQSLAASKSIQLRIRPCSIWVHSDPMLLERIIVNLISNALRYTPTGGIVLLACRKRGDHLRIEVRDNGIGIPHNEQKNIFQEFVQLANKERDRSMGLGLGLAIVERLSKLLQHPVSLSSDLGKGSVFSIDVPIVKSVPDWTPSKVNAVQDKIENIPQKQSEFETAKLLVVDDDPLVRASTHGILSSWGYRVYLAASWKEVRDKFGQYVFDLVICDYRLPDGTGLDVINFINLKQEKQLPCILVSGDTSPEILQRVTESGFNLLSKPVRPAKLRSLIQFLLAESKSSTH